MKIITVRNSVVVEVTLDSDENYNEKKYVGTEIEDSAEVSVGDFWDPLSDTPFTPLTKVQKLEWDLKPVNLSWGRFSGKIEKSKLTSILTDDTLSATVEVDKVHGVDFTSTSYTDANIFTVEEWDSIFEYEAFATGSV